jgi:hypothetical protein
MIVNTEFNFPKARLRKLKKFASRSLEASFVAEQPGTWKDSAKKDCYRFYGASGQGMSAGPA